MNIKIIIYISLLFLVFNCSKRETKCKSYREQYPNGKLKLEGCLIDDTVRHGKFTEYYQSGKVKRVVNYVKNKREGKELWYWENGELKAQLNYKNDILSNKQITYNDSGKLLSEYEFINGQKVGPVISFYNNGNVREYSFYSLNGKPIYKITYDSSGLVESEEGSLIPVINFNSDEFKIGDTLQVDIHVINPPNYEIELIAGYLDEKNKFIKEDTLEIKNGISKFIKRINSLEGFHWAVLVEATDNESNSVKTYINSLKVKVIK